MSQHPPQPSSPDSKQLEELTAQPIRTQLNATEYEWAGPTLQQLLGTPKRVAEIWPFFSGEQQPAQLLHPGGAGEATLRELLAANPGILGPAGADPQHQHQKYFFVKFLDPSDFPPFAYVGFDPKRLQRLRDQLERQRAQPFETDDAWTHAFRGAFADLLWQDRQSLDAVRQLLLPHLKSPESFAQLKQRYKQWAIKQAQANWQEVVPIDWSAWLDPAQRAEAEAIVRRQQRIRREITLLMHRIDFRDDQALLIGSPTLHAIAGLSLQLHPNSAGQRFPKDEAWIYKSIENAQGARIGWILVEPQRTFDVTESGADFFTPFAWTPDGLGFRKPITRALLDRFVSLMDAEAKPAQHYQRTAQPMEVPGAKHAGAVQWYRTIEEASWPYFIVRELRFAAAGSTMTPLIRESFTELHATQGTVEGVLRRGTTIHRFTITPAAPALLPATLPYDTIEYCTTAPAQLVLVTRRVTRKA